MTRRARVTAAALLLAGTVARGQAPPAPRTTPQQFRAATDAVMVDVSVRRGGTMIAGLAAGDFVLLDNGVRQRIDSVEASSIPIDLTLVVDLSSDPRGVLVKVEPGEAVKMAGALDEDVRHVTEILRPDDRVRLLAIDTYTRQVFAPRPATAVTPIGRIESGGMASLYDALAAALLQPVEPNRRHVVVARTKGKDTISAIDAQTVAAIVQHSDALFHLVMMEKAADNEDELFRIQCDGLTPGMGMGLCWPTRKFWVPFTRRMMAGAPFHALQPDGLAVAGASDATGGALHQATGFTEPTLLGEFRRAFDDFRASYVLRYTPQGVTREGWHDIAVTVPSAPGATVHARKGYAIESPTAPATAAAPPAAPAGPARIPRTLDELTAAYARADYPAVATGFQQTVDPPKLIRDFTDAGNPWPAAPRREAAFALELAETGMFSHRANARDEAQKLLDRFTRLVRHPLEPDVFERRWLWAELTILEGTLRPLVAQAAVTKALDRFPNEPRFVMARAIATDQLFPFNGAVRTAAMTANGDATPAHIRNVTERYADTMTDPGTAPEAHVRFGWFLHRIGRDEEALAQLDGVVDEQSPDRMFRYYRQLFRGHALTALGRGDDAMAAFRAALAIWPGAQSARVALMNSLLAHGDRAEAEAMAETIQTATADVVDPWWTYWQGDYRFYPSAMARVRESIQ